MAKKGAKLYDLVDLTNPQDVLNELKYIIALMTTGFDYALFEQIYDDIGALFQGDFPGYQASNTQYHDLEHTHSVVLAAARLMHGATVEGYSFSAQNLMVGLLGAFFHDIGFIQTDSDLTGSGAKYTVGHEERSIDFMKHYLSEKALSDEDIENCAHVIRCTILNLAIDDVPFNSDQIKMLGQIVGSADLLAQMADREYLEKLFMLYKEFEEAGMPGYRSEMELLSKTEDFYKNTVLQRLNEDCGGAFAHMRSHFKARWNLDEDLYQKSIIGNIEYLRNIVAQCNNSFVCYMKHLRRRGMAEKFKFREEPQT